MFIDWNAFTPWHALMGGALVGTAAALFVLLNGRIAGISGVLGGLLRPVKGDVAWRAAFVIGLIVAPLIYLLFGSPPKPRIDADFGALVLAGLLVGVGTRYGAGCTSGGHMWRTNDRWRWSHRGRMDRTRANYPAASCAPVRGIYRPVSALPGARFPSGIR